ncbi:Retrovirus-related Pol polyprotein from transposon RE1 [Vitis vinifera]|uniref:Retrovirus-related Pol polyprotein from transposon RE1 n=1 Tax=Vitis vinifera TaxID=29760 RepID=A0A438HT76_VITVI|nr:Retrovirus-related Pol polyprotein from transposon RE1 [Vitis vinifera]
MKIQLKDREYMLPANTSKLKVHSRKGKSTTSSHIPSSKPESGNENTHSSVYNDLYWPIALRKGTKQCTQHPISNFTSLHCLSSTYRAFITQMSFVEIPNTIQEALRDENCRKAINEEMQALEKNENWDIVELPKGKKTVGCKWIFTIKYKAAGTIERYKARLVVKGLTKTYGIDYQETFALVAKMNTIQEEVYMDTPPRSGDKAWKNKVCKLKKSLYGLK